MKVINKVEVPKEELEAIKKVSNLECSGSCNSCPLHLSSTFGCIKTFTRYTLQNVNITVEVE